MKKIYLIFVFLLSCHYLHLKADPIKTIDPYDEIVWEVSLPFGISDVAYHPNGLTVFAACGSVIHQRDTKGGSFIKQYWIGDKNFQFTDIDLSKDGKLIAGCGTNYFKSVIIFDVETGQEKIRLKDTVEFFNPTEFRSVSFSPDGKKLVATAGNVDNSTSMVYLFDVETGAIISRLYNPRKPAQYEKEYKRYRKALFSNDGSYIIVASEIRTLIFRCNTENLNPIDTLIDRGYSNFNYSENIVMTIDNNQEYCFLSGFSNDGFLLNINTKKIDPQRSAKFSATCLVFNKINNKIIDSEGISKLVTYDLTTNKPIYIYKTASDYFSLSPNDSLLVSYTFQNLKLLKTRWDTPSSINNESQNILPIYPNPSKENFSVPLNCSELGSEVKVISSSGKMVYNKQLENNIEESLNIDCSKWAKGAYFIQVICNNQIKNYKVIIE